jgi:hypothetical protein
MAQHEAKFAALKKGGGTFTYDGLALDTETTPPEIDGNGKVLKPAKLRHLKIETYKIAGVSFPTGKAVAIANPVLALKLRTLSCFVEGEPEKMKEPKAKPEA